MSRNPKLKECLPIVNGIWSHINYEFPDIFDLDPTQLDIMFLSNWSMRTAAPILNVIHDSEATSPMLSDAELNILAGIVNGMYKFKWDKLMAVALAEYDPIHNYADILTETIEYSEEGESSKTASGSNSSTRTDNLNETATDGRQVQETKNLTNTETDTRQIQDTKNLSEIQTDTRQIQDTKNLTEQQTDTRQIADTKNLTETQTDTRLITETRNLSKSGSNEVENGVYGFNSSSAVGDTNSEGENSSTETGTIATQHSGTLTTANSGTDTEVHSGNLTTTNTGTDTEVHSGNISTTNTGTDTTVHSGNVTTTNTGTDTTVHSGNLTTTNTGTQSNSGTVSSSESVDDEKSGTRTREYTKTGNIGNISTQKLLKEEIDLWKYNFICEIMRDVANFISLPIYEQE